MIIFFEKGRTGNQLFQYCALRSICGGGAIFMIGAKALMSIIDGVEISGARKWESVIARIIYLLGKKKWAIIAKRMRLISLIEEIRTPPNTKLVVRHGFFKQIYYCDTAYFQSEAFISESVARKLHIKRQFLEKAEDIIDQLSPDRSKIFFVHVRRGDYLFWPSVDLPAVLPITWYREQMDLIRSKFSNPFFVIVSDDLPYVNGTFANNEDVFVSRESEGVDLALMSLCNGGGILSASSFAWWAAYFARRNNNAAYLIAPLFWGGHSYGEWYPPGIQTCWLTYVAVK